MEPHRLRPGRIRLRAAKAAASYDPALAADRAVTDSAHITNTKTPGQTPRSDLHAASRMPNPPHWLTVLDLTKGRRKW